MTLSDALEKARPGLRYKIEQSVALLRKAEKLALRYDPENGFFLAYSGGKDSQALYHTAELAGVRFKAHFSPTTVDPPQLIRFIRHNYPDVEFEKVEKSMYQMAKDMGMVPTRRLRWCCARFKETAGAGKVTLTGIRKQESAKRAKRQSVEVTGKKFAGDLGEFEQWSEEKIRKKIKNLNQDEFTRDKQQEIRCINGKDSIIVNPMLEWTDADVWDFLNKVMEVPHCELYDPPYNQHRIGCILCPMSGPKQHKRDIELWPHAKEKWIDVFRYYISDLGYDCNHFSINKLAQERERERDETRNGKRRWAGVSQSAEELFDWWAFGDCDWDTFKAKKALPTLFGTEIEGEKE